MIPHIARGTIEATRDTHPYQIYATAWSSGECFASLARQFHSCPERCIHYDPNGDRHSQRIFSWLPSSACPSTLCRFLQGVGSEPCEPNQIPISVVFPFTTHFMLQNFPQHLLQPRISSNLSRAKESHIYVNVNCSLFGLFVTSLHPTSLLLGRLCLPLARITEFRSRALSN